MQLMIPDPLNSEKMIPVSPEEHPLNKEAMEILLALENLEPEQEDQLILEHSHLPILELIERVVGIEGIGLTHPGLPEKWFKLQEMPDERAMRLLGGPYQENGLPVLTTQELELLRMSPPPPPPRRPPEVALETFDQIQEWIATQPVSLIPKGSPLEKRENLLARLRRDLLHLLMDVQHEMNLRQKRHDQLMDWFQGRRAARQDEGKVPLGALTPKQEEILLDLVGIVIKDTIAELTEKETLDEFEQEILATLHTDSNTLTTEQTLLLQDLIDIAFEDEIDRLTQKKNLTDSEQELFEVLQVLQIKGTLESEPLFLAEQTPESVAESEPSTTPELEVNTQSEPSMGPESALIANDPQESTVLTAQLLPDASEVELNLSEDVRGALSAAQVLVLKMMKRSGKMFHRFLKDGTLYRLGFLSDNGIGDSKTKSTAFTPEQVEFLLEQVQSIIENKIKRLTGKETLNELEQEFLEVLQIDKELLKTGQAELSEKTIAIIIENEIERLTGKETLNDREQILLETLQATTPPDSMPEAETSLETETNSKPAETPDTNPAQKKVGRCSEDQVKDIVADYFKSLRTASPNYSVKREYLIQMGSDRRRADIVFLRNGNLVAIAECKRTGRVEKGNEQLKSYLCATDTFLGIFANDSDPNKWIFWENHRHNNFLEIDRETFENYIYNHDKAIKDRGKKIKLEIEREIDAEIRERVRKNTDTNAIRQDETDRIKREVMENIDKTAIVNSMRSQIAQQVENGLLNKRDEENRKHGRSQGFWWTILSIIGFGILIALLTSAA